MFFYYCYYYFSLVFFYLVLLFIKWLHNDLLNFSFCKYISSHPASICSKLVLLPGALLFTLSISLTKVLLVEISGTKHLTYLVTVDFTFKRCICACYIKKKLEKNFFVVLLNTIVYSVDNVVFFYSSYLFHFLCVTPLLLLETITLTSMEDGYDDSILVFTRHLSDIKAC